MTTTYPERVRLNNRAKKRFHPHLATLIMLGVVGVLASISLAWFAGEPSTSNFFKQLNALQNSPPAWLEVPRLAGHYLLAPTVLLLLVALLTMRLSPYPRQWSRVVVVGVLLALTGRYIAWRTCSTLNLADPLNGVFSLGLLLPEMTMLVQTCILLFLMLWTRDRRREADQKSVAVLEGSYLPSVDVLIPTYNEPEFVLRRTIIGCQALDYPNKTIYLLDDTHRPEVRQLAAELGCEYTTRPDNRHAKAGNLNHAIAHTTGELIVVFDADFVPTRNFLTRTVGFFQDQQVALIQTPQSFYNFDPIAHNLGLENIITNDEEIFYRQVHPILDGVGSGACVGSSFVVRRSVLEEIGGFVTESLSEDYFTGVRLSAEGYKVIYLNEKLSAGLAADSMTAYAMQRFRWARGTLQAFFIHANPLKIRGLNPLQRLAHFYIITTWFNNLAWIGFLLVPLAYSFLGVIPIKASAAELIYFYLPSYIIHTAVFCWLSYRSRSALMSNIYSLVIALPLAVTIVQILLAPFSTGFKVTPKGTARDRFSFNWGLALPLIFLFITTAIGLVYNLQIWLVQGWSDFYDYDAKGLSWGWIWSAYNLLMISVALAALVDAPKFDRYEWFALNRTAHLSLQHPTVTSAPHFWGMTTMISEGGAEIALTQAQFPEVANGDYIPVILHLPEENLTLQGVATGCGTDKGLSTVRVLFKQVSLEHHRQLVELLFCRPGQWKRQTTPGEFQSLWLMLRALLKPKILFDRKARAQAIAVTNG